MKQGSGKSTHMQGTKGAGKKVSVASVAAMGAHESRGKLPLYKGKVAAGAPKTIRTDHKTGSQRGK